MYNLNCCLVGLRLKGGDKNVLERRRGRRGRKAQGSEIVHPKNFSCQKNFPGKKHKRRRILRIFLSPAKRRIFCACFFDTFFLRVQYIKEIVHFFWLLWHNAVHTNTVFLVHFYRHANNPFSHKSMEKERGKKIGKEWCDGGRNGWAKYTVTSHSSVQ